MAQAPGALTPPIFNIIGGALYYSVDNGATWIAPTVAGSITTGVGLSGNGTGGSPARLDAGTRITASGAQAALDITGLSGATDGGYEIEGAILNVSGNVDYIVQINGTTTGYATQIVYGAAGTIASQTGNFGAGANTAGIAVIRAGSDSCAFRFTVGPSGGGAVFVAGVATNYTAATGALGNPGFVYFNGTYVPSAAVNEIKIVTADGSSNMLAGSYVRYRKLGFTS